MIRINQMKLNIEHTSDDFERKILKTLCIKKRNFRAFKSANSRSMPEKSLFFIMSIL